MDRRRSRQKKVTRPARPRAIRRESPPRRSHVGSPPRILRYSSNPDVWAKARRSWRFLPIFDCSARQRRRRRRLRFPQRRNQRDQAQYSESKEARYIFPNKALGVNLFGLAMTLGQGN